MYISEWLMWFGDSVSAPIRRKWQMPKLAKHLRPSDFRRNYTKIKVSDNPRPIGPYYAYNDSYLEIRGGRGEHFRGIITLLGLVLFLIPSSYAYLAIKMIARIVTNQESDLAPAILFVSFYSLLFIIFGYFFIYYCRHICRFELFTLRHIRVRFNRVTQQVFIQRPKHCGGTVVFRWKDIMPINTDSHHSNQEQSQFVNIFYFPSYKTGLPFSDGFSIGKNTNRPQDNRDEWEFIRRYMETGLAGLPKPRLTTTLPLPFRGWQEQIKPIFDVFNQTPKLVSYLILIPSLIFILPLLSFGYFLSECLCWQFKWPEAIQEAGKIGRLKPKETQLLDYPITIWKNQVDDNS